MKHTRRNLELTLLTLLLLSFLASCSNKGVHMPKHRKRRHCDCPTFAYTTPQHPTTEDGTILY